MIYSAEVEHMTCVAKGPNHGPAPIPEEGRWVQAKEIKDISGLTHGVGWCAPQQGACKLTLNVKDGIIEEALVETIGCSGMTHSRGHGRRDPRRARPSSRRSTPISCATPSTRPCASCSCRSSTAARQTAFSEGGLPIGAGLEDLGKGLRSAIGTMYGTVAKGPRYLEMAEGYVTRLAPRREQTRSSATSSSTSAR